MVVGNYGSGKTEVAVNFALHLAGNGRRVSIADLDIVNPYFRCREARALMETAGIRVVVPPAAQTWADLPIVVPEIKGMLQPADDRVSLFDVGGDDVGARILASFRQALGPSPYQLWQVLNARRPFTNTVEGCLAMRAGIEKSSRLRVTGFILNTHLMQETTAEVILEGIEMGREVSGKSGVPIRFATAMGDLAKDERIQRTGLPILALSRHMLPPWLRKKGEGEEREEAQDLPAKKPVPLGRRR